MSSNIRAENKHSSSSSRITSLPEDVLIDILARVPICDYLRVSLVSKYFKSLVSSPKIYPRRSSLGCTEHCLYVVMYNWDNKHKRLYTLRQKEKDNGLVLIPGLPDMPSCESFVAVGSRIYAFCEINSFNIDCTSHTVQHLPRMPLPLSDIVTDFIGGRIYVFGHHSTTYPELSYGNGMLVFDTETQTWEGPKTVPGMHVRDGCLVVMAGKMYMIDFENSIVYDPKKSKWETKERLNSKFWEYACAVDDVLYSYSWSSKELRAYDPEHKCWQVVKGVEDLSAEIRRTGCRWPKCVCYGGKLFLLYGKGEFSELVKEICCAQISLERRKGGQIWGKVDQWCDHILIAGNFFIIKSLDVVL